MNRTYRRKKNGKRDLYMVCDKKFLANIFSCSSYLVKDMLVDIFPGYWNQIRCWLNIMWLIIQNVLPWSSTVINGVKCFASFGQMNHLNTSKLWCLLYLSWNISLEVFVLVQFLCLGSSSPSLPLYLNSLANSFLLNKLPELPNVFSESLWNKLVALRILLFGFFFFALFSYILFKIICILVAIIFAIFYYNNQHMKISETKMCLLIYDAVLITTWSVWNCVACILTWTWCLWWYLWR